MVELTIGSRFYKHGKLVEVCVYDGTGCGECIFNNIKPCRLKNCHKEYRHDEKDVIYKVVDNEVL